MELRDTWSWTVIHNHHEGDGCNLRCYRKRTLLGWLFSAAR